MNNKIKEGTIPKSIYEAIYPPKIRNLIQSNSAILFQSKQLMMFINEYESNDEKKENDMVNDRIGDYLIKYTLGQGTFGKVKLGIYLPKEEKVAIKILEKSRMLEKDDEIRVKREFNMLAQFNHPNVILVAEIFESENSFYSVMEFCEGGELFNYIVKRNHLTEEESSFFFFQLINGLEYIHSLGIVHRDLKPENLLLTKDHVLKIIDFGLSNYFKENQVPLLSTPCGSPCYASPEMVAGKKYDGFKIDVWSCGIILYAMLCGYLPFEDSNNDILFKQILECKLEFPKYVQRFKTGIDLIEKILVVDPEKRITIPEIKKHPFYLKGKELFEQEFIVTQEILDKTNEKNKKEKNETDIIINDMEKNNDEKKPRLIEDNVNNKENVDKENINKNIELKNKEEKKNEEKKKEEKKVAKEDIIKRIGKELKKGMDEILKKMEKKEKIKKEKLDKEKEKLNKKEKNKIINKEDKMNNDKYDRILTEQKVLNKPLNNEYINIRIDNNTTNDDNETIHYLDKDFNLTSKNIKNNEKFRTKGKEKEKNKKKEKNEDIIIKKIEKINHKEKENKKKGKETSKEKLKDKEKEKIKDKEGHLETIKYSKPKISSIKIVGNEENKRTITPKRKITHFKAIKTPHLSNISKNINLKGIILKIVEQNKNLDKLLSIKKKFKKKASIKNININQYTYIPSQKIKGILTGLQTNKRTSLDKKDRDRIFFNLNTEKNKNNKFMLKENTRYKTIKVLNNNITDNIDDNKWQRLKTEVIKNKNMNYLDKRKKSIYIDNTLDNIKKNIGYISDAKRIPFHNTKKNKKYDINSYIIDQRNKRTDSNTFSETNTISTYNKSINKANIMQNKNNRKKLSKKLKFLPSKGNLEHIITTYSNRKSTYDSEISDNINVKTEPSEYATINNRDNHCNHFRSNANTIEVNKLHRVLHPKKLNYNHPATYFHYLNSIRKGTNPNVKNNNNIIKKIRYNDILKTNQDNNKYLLPKSNKTAISSKKNSFITIRSTVINFNMINSGLVLPPFNKKNQDKKKYNLMAQYNSNNQHHNHNNTKKNINESSELLMPQKTFNNNNINNNNTSLNKKLYLNQYCSKPLYKTKTLTKNHIKNRKSFNTSLNSKNLLNSLNQRLKEQTLANKSINRINVMTSFKKLVNKNKKKHLLYNKKHSNSLERSDIIFKSIKLNEYYLKILKQRKEKKNLHCGNNTNINTIIQKELKTFNPNKTIRPNSFENKSKKTINNSLKK